ncbi:glycosyltransferase family 1 protein [Ideonella sp. 4Y11]|uniref:Glycosyltransferase family 1 protein n=1 Tax=Ideonella aquatica TaxID=2824119 RepID=A0A941BJV2_9BURK|nr:glycosyltransferase [Ideonella aquatica]MBQ0959263.1 glycosyltransferase family 1 protein [Ideonella aquatica]
MSRVLVATLGSVGDLQPFLALARALRQRGHSVLFLSSEPHRASVEAEGLAFEPILSAHDHERAASHPDLWHPIRGFGVLWRHLAVRSVDSTVAILERESASHPHTPRVLASPLVLGARLAVDLLPYRLITAHTAPNGLRHLGDPLFLGAWRVPGWWPRAWRRAAWQLLDRWKLQPMAAPFINRWRMRRGFAALQEPVFERWLHSPHQVIGLFPEAFSPAADDLPVPMHCVGFPLFRPQVPILEDPGLQLWLGQQVTRPRLVIYAGSSHHHRASAFQACAERLDALGWPTLLLLPGSAPARFGEWGLIRPWVDLRHTLPRVGGWLHHGGIGACAEGLMAGVRQWTFPSAYDQFENSWHVAQRMALPLDKVQLDEAQLHAGRLPGLTSLADWPVTPRLTSSEGGDSSIDQAVQLILQG